MCKSNKVWDITTTQAIDSGAERTSATLGFQRVDVEISIKENELILSNNPAMYLGNANGFDLQLYPSFIVMTNKKGDFGVVDINKLDFIADSCPFIEEEKIPEDAEIIRQTWNKVNKDGSPDKRYKDNYQIPIVQYFSFVFKSSSGLNEAYLLSNYQLAIKFSNSFSEYLEMVKK